MSSSKFSKNLPPSKHFSFREEYAPKPDVRFGRPRKLNTDQEKLARRRLSEGREVKEIVLPVKVHPTTIYRYVAAR